MDAETKRDAVIVLVEALERAEAAEARIAQIVALLGDVEKMVWPGDANMEWLSKVQAWRDAS
jgi:hypothetical protein